MPKPLSTSSAGGFTFLRRSLDKERDAYTLCQWKFDAAQTLDADLKPADGSTVLRGQLALNDSRTEEQRNHVNDKTILSLKATTLPKYGEVWLLHAQVK